MSVVIPVRMTYCEVIKYTAKENSTEMIVSEML
jgi:hypothetical protein